jgi:hypothetical protein
MNSLWSLEHESGFREHVAWNPAGVRVRIDYFENRQRSGVQAASLGSEKLAGLG